MSLYSIVSQFSDRVNDGRTLRDIFTHAEGEMRELDSDVGAIMSGTSDPGPDGILGEAIDVIACMMDLIRKQYPDITDEELEWKMTEKCAKWERKTNAGEYRDR